MLFSANLFASKCLIKFDSDQSLTTVMRDVALSQVDTNVNIFMSHLSWNDQMKSRLMEKLDANFKTKGLFIKAMDLIYKIINGDNSVAIEQMTRTYVDYPWSGCSKTSFDKFNVHQTLTNLRKSLLETGQILSGSVVDPDDKLQHFFAKIQSPDPSLNRYKKMLFSCLMVNILGQTLNVIYSDEYPSEIGKDGHILFVQNTCEKIFVEFCKTTENYLNISLTILSLIHTSIILLIHPGLIFENNNPGKIFLNKNYFQQRVFLVFNFFYNFLSFQYIKNIFDKSTTTVKKKFTLNIHMFGSNLVAKTACIGDELFSRESLQNINFFEILKREMQDHEACDFKSELTRHIALHHPHIQQFVSLIARERLKRPQIVTQKECSKPKTKSAKKRRSEIAKGDSRERIKHESDINSVIPSNHVLMENENNACGNKNPSFVEADDCKKYLSAQPTEEYLLHLFSESLNCSVDEIKQNGIIDSTCNLIYNQISQPEKIQNEEIKRKVLRFCSFEKGLFFPSCEETVIYEEFKKIIFDMFLPSKQILLDLFQIGPDSERNLDVCKAVGITYKWLNRDWSELMESDAHPIFYQKLKKKLDKDGFFIFREQPEGNDFVIKIYQVVLLLHKSFFITIDGNLVIKFKTALQRMINHLFEINFEFELNKQILYKFFNECFCLIDKDGELKKNDITNERLLNAIFS